MTDLRLKHPFTCIIAGPTSSGKSVFVERLLTSGEKLLDTTFEEIVWCYSEWHPKNLSVQGKVRFHKGLVDFKRSDSRGARIIVVDDLMQESNSSMVEFFTRGSHHTNCSIIYITQNIFHQGKGQRDISLNSHYLVVFKNPRDSAQIIHLARQISPRNPKFIQDAYAEATRRPHGYLLFDLKQSTPDDCRIRTNIFGEGSPGFPVVFIPVDKGSKLRR